MAPDCSDFLDIVLALKFFSISWVAHYDLWAKFNPPPVFVSKVLLKCRPTHCLHNVAGCFRAKVAEWSSQFLREGASQNA